MKNSYILIHRHNILLLLTTMKYVFFTLLVMMLMWLSLEYKYIFSPDFSNYIFIPILIGCINYIFLHIILDGIDFYGKIMLIGGESIVITHTSFLLVDDIEFVNTKSILKLDIERHGLLANIFNYGNLVIEQRNDVRRIHYLPQPFEVYDMIKHHLPPMDDALHN